MLERAGIWNIAKYFIVRSCKEIISGTKYFVVSWIKLANVFVPASPWPGSQDSETSPNIYLVEILSKNLI